MDKKLYTDFSALDVFFKMFLRLIPIGAFIYCFPHYNENPVLIGIICFLCVLGFLVIGSSYITIYPDRITQSSDSILSLVYKRNSGTYFINDIASVYTQPPFSENDKAGEIGAAIVLGAITAIVSGRNNRSVIRRRRIFPITLTLNNSKEVSLITSNSDYKNRQEITTLINSLIKQNTPGIVKTTRN